MPVEWEQRQGNIDEQRIKQIDSERDRTRTQVDKNEERIRDIEREKEQPREK